MRIWTIPRGIPVLFLLLATCSQIAPPSATVVSNGAVRILLAGDVMLGRGVAKVAAGDPFGVFGDVRAEVQSADIAVANLESPLTSRPHVADTPNVLEADPGTAGLVADAGFEAMSVANNHAGDAGLDGFGDTLGALGRAGILPIGGGSDAQHALAPTIVVRNGVRVALLAFDATLQGPPAGEGVAGVASWSAPAARAAVLQARASADVVVVGLHGGVEYSTRPDAYLSGLAALLAGWGADIVWASGPHVVQPVHVIGRGRGRPTVVATSLGNFVFDQTQPGTTTGGLLQVLADRDGVIAYQVGRTDGSDFRAHFARWLPPGGDSADLDGSWWSLLRPVDVEATTRPSRLPHPPGRHIRISAAVMGDVDADGRQEIVVAYRSSFHPTLVNQLYQRRRWADANELAAHLGVWRAGSLKPVWVAGTMFRPIAALAVCGTNLSVTYQTLRSPAIVGTGVLRWSGFGFASVSDLAGHGSPGCADVDHDGAVDAVVLGRSGGSDIKEVRP
jgi:Bacterial capsule synthesis protein PGA_cap